MSHFILVCINYFPNPGCIDVSIAADIYSDLTQALDSIVLSSDLHLLYLIVPRDMMSSIQPNWTAYFEIVNLKN